MQMSYFFRNLNYDIEIYLKISNQCSSWHDPDEIQTNDSSDHRSTQIARRKAMTGESESKPS